MAFGRIALLVSMLSGATFTTFAKDLRTVFSPLSLVFVSELLTVFFVLFAFGALPTVRSVVRIKRKYLLPLFAIGIFSGVAGPLLYFASLSMTSAVNASMFSRLDVIIMIMMAHFFLREKLGREHYLAIGSVCIGLLFIVPQGFSASLSLRLGDLLILASTMCYASGSIIFRKYLSKIDPHVALICRSLIAISAFFLLSPFLEHTFAQDIQKLSITLLPSLLGFGFLSRFLNVVMYYHAIERVPVTTASLFGSMDIFISILFAHLYLGETIQWYHWIGGSFMLLGNIILAFYHTPSTREQGVRVLRHKH
jgi:drug/metabolite transporter (DMT)-like permease